MTKIRKSIYLDTNVSIRFVESEDADLLFLFEQAAADIVELVTSEFTLAGVLVGPLRSGDARLAGVYEDFLTSDNVLTVIPVDRTIMRKSAEIRARSSTKGPDALHVATAVASGCHTFVSSDRRLQVPEELVRLDLSDVQDIDRWL